MLLAEKDHDDDGTSPSSPACLWNPLTGERLPLPNIGLEEHEIPRFCKCFLTHKDPSHPGCAVVLFHLATPVLWYCHVAHGGDGWRRHAYDIGNYPIPEAYRRPTKAIISIIASFQGKLYFMKSPTEMCAVDFSPARAQPTFQFFDVHRSARYPQAMSSGRDWLVESQDQLFLVSVRFIGFDPDNIGATCVYRMDFSSSKRARWISVRDIGDVVFLLEDANVAASCPASALGLKANQIYFMKNMWEDDANMCVFDLESNSHEITRVHQHDDLLLRRKPFWIVPPN
ncbi:hypothetical protein HU200_044936 [Digitaria exilis]|uniref:KIB1-4 beta-propeller domain-containing protein n=1 Tax=Digitaria exilis TaxID=1010633 RepID=A0A835EB82_9POAL|nr:hypothetical protein HU200_044936 [Digitaria exilis]